MKRTLWMILLCVFLLTGCQKEKVLGKEVSAAEEPTNVVYDAGLFPTEDRSHRNWSLQDFPGCMDELFPAQTSTYPLTAGEEYENTVSVISSGQEGAAIYIVGGVHGDETAGWAAGNLLKETTLRTGTLYVLSPANLYGAEHEQRETRDKWDLNRNFPGDSEGVDAEQIAAAIYADIAEKQPDIVLDLHETCGAREDRDDLTNAVICQDIEPISGLVMGLLIDSETGKLCGGPLTLYGSPPTGSINKTVSGELGIPVITVETNREEPLGQRVRKQLELAEYVLQYYNLR